MIDLTELKQLTERIITETDGLTNQEMIYLIQALVELHEERKNQNDTTRK